MSDTPDQPREPSKEAMEAAHSVIREMNEGPGRPALTHSIAFALDAFALSDRRRVAEDVRMTCCKGVCIWCDMDVPIKLNDEASTPCLYHWIEDEKRFRKCEATNLHAIDLSPIIEGRGA